MFADAKLGIDQSREVVVLASVPAAAGAGAWTDAREVGLDPAGFNAAPSESAPHTTLPPIASKPKSYETWRRELDDHLYRTTTLALFRCTPLGLVSKPGESERDFRIRLQEGARIARDAAIEKLRAKYAPKLERLQGQIQRAQSAREREKTQLDQQKMQAAVSLGARCWAPSSVARPWGPAPSAAPRRRRAASVALARKPRMSPAPRTALKH